MRDAQDSYCTCCGRDVPRDYILWTPAGLTWRGPEDGVEHYCTTCSAEQWGREVQCGRNNKSMQE